MTRINRAAHPTPREVAAPSLPAAVKDAHHPAARRVSDVLRSRSTQPRTILIDDRENITQAAQAGVQLLAIYTSPDQAACGELLQRDAPDAEMHVLSVAALGTLFRDDRQSRVFALARAPRSTNWDGLAARRGDLVVLDGVRITGNIGAIIRSACAFNAAGVILLDSGLYTVFDRRLIRASRGLIFTVPVLTATRAEFETFLATERIPLALLSLDAELPLGAIREAAGRVALLLGSERHGATAALTRRAVRQYRIPMMPGVESLNVSVAAGLALYERQGQASQE